MIFIIRDEHNEILDQTIAKHVLNVHMNKVEEIRGDIDIQKMRSFFTSFQFPDKFFYFTKFFTGSLMISKGLEHQLGS